VYKNFETLCAKLGTPDDRSLPQVGQSIIACVQDRKSFSAATALKGPMPWSSLPVAGRLLSIEGALPLMTTMELRSHAQQNALFRAVSLNAAVVHPAPKAAL
jgi:hypothetical protein